MSWIELRICDQVSLDDFLASQKEHFTKPKCSDYSTSTSSIIKGRRGYIGRDFDSLLQVLEECAQSQLPLEQAAKRTMQAVNNYGEFLNSHFCFQLMLFSRYEKQHRSISTGSIILYAASLHFSSELPRALVTRRNTLKLFTILSATGPEIVPIKPRDLPEEYTAFCVFKRALMWENTLVFASSVIRKLARLGCLEVTATFEVVLERFAISVPSRTWRPDNMLVQACMAQKLFAAMSAIDDDWGCRCDLVITDCVSPHKWHQGSK